MSTGDRVSDTAVPPPPSAGGLGDLLRSHRDAQNLTQSELAERAGLKPPSIASYESGRRRPTGVSVRRLARALHLNRASTNDLLEAAGHQPLERAPNLGHHWPLSRLQGMIDRYPWPCFIQNERSDAVLWNAAAERVAEFDFARETPRIGDRNMMRIAARQHIIDRCLNWDAIVAQIIGLWKSNQQRLDEPEATSEHFDALVRDLQRDPRVFARVLDLWTRTPAHDFANRLTFPAQWRLGDGTRLNFHCFLAYLDEYDSLSTFDWIPADGDTWEWLRERDGSAEPPPTTSSLADTPAMAPFDRLLRDGRVSTGLTQTQVAQRAGVAFNTLQSYETGRRQPNRDTILRLAWAMDLDTVTLNAMLDARGLPPEPSDYARLLRNRPRRTRNWQSYPVQALVKQSRTRMTAVIDAHPWPCVALDSAGSILHANGAMRGVLLPKRPAGSRPPASLVDLLLGEPTRTHINHWDQLVRIVFGHGFQRDTDRGAATAHHAIADALRGLDPASLTPLQSLLESAPLVDPDARLTVPLEWQTEGGDKLRFIAVLMLWSAPDRIWALDWLPADRTTWRQFGTD